MRGKRAKIISKAARIVWEKTKDKVHPSKEGMYYRFLYKKLKREWTQKIFQEQEKHKNKEKKQWLKKNLQVST